MFLSVLWNVSLFRILVFLIALAPSFWYLWQASGLPHLGHFQDDGVYAGTAAAIVDGKGPRVESLPGEPWQVKYPPLFPAYLALAANNTRVMAALLWILLPALLYVVWLWRKNAMLLVLLGWNAYSVLFAGSALSELFGTVWLMAAILLLERNHVKWSALLAGLAYLARTANIAAAAGCVLWLLWRRRFRDAVLFAAVFAPVFLAWTWFTAAHTDPSATGDWAFYLSYTRFYLENVNPAIFPDMLWTNFQMLVAGLGGLLFFNAGDSTLEINFARLLLFASISGLIRQTRKQGAMPYAFVAVLYSALLIVWNYVPQERFLFPLLPLLLSGFLAEMEHLRTILTANWQKQRGAAITIGLLLAAGLTWSTYRNTVAAWQFAPSIPTRYAAILPERAAAYDWIRAHTPENANFLTSEDTLLRRATGRHGLGFHFPTRYFYTNDHAAVLAYHRDIVPRMRAQGLQYLLAGPNDMEMDLRPEDRDSIRKSWLALPEMETVYASRLYVVRRLK